MDRILCVDDDANILAAFERQLRKQFQIETALGALEGLQRLSSNGPFAVIVSDLRMPVMDGIQFLSRAREHSPDSVRIMLTGNADLQTAIDAVNEGNIFRFLTKPCPAETLAKAIQAGVRQYRLIMAERELLENTLSGSVKVLTEVLALISPAAFGRASRVRRLMGRLAAQLRVEKPWEFEIAAMLSQIGCVTIPPNVLEKIYRGESLSLLETRMFEAHPQVGHDLVAHIPRLENVAQMILYQERRYDGQSVPPDGPREEQIPLGARALHVALDFDTLVSSGLEGRRALAVLKTRPGCYDPGILEALTEVVKLESRYEARLVGLSDLVTRMILAEDVVTTGGLLLIAKGQEVTPSLKARLTNFAGTMEVKQPIRVLVPV